jgi:hypothetical protein
MRSANHALIARGISTSRKNTPNGSSEIVTNGAQALKDVAAMFHDQELDPRGSCIPEATSAQTDFSYNSVQRLVVSLRRAHAPENR